MSLATPELLSAISDIAKIREMKIAVNVSARCGFIAGIATVAGGLIGGPPGIAFGGLIGTGIASLHAKGKFKSVPEILSTEATPEQKEKLATAIRNLLTAEKIFTLIELAAVLQNNVLLMEAIQRIVRNFLMSDMGYNTVL